MEETRETTESMRNDIQMVAENTGDHVGNRCFCRVNQGKERESRKKGGFILETGRY